MTVAAPERRNRGTEEEIFDIFTEMSLCLSHSESADQVSALFRALEGVRAASPALN